ncbi:hypothetical protein BCR34DRAFT_602508 [Clohesyomyces aquaticus]|uniref:Uncharacterized protein n=1 Tax=Clohesyomyces aquaticus TaxID=1231657 RepID=A0A1Y1ZI37_9PLEO|nr:hypothetical protein BCR34DRAFT_602508 [Clohesyomyces aquaticus]
MELPTGTNFHAALARLSGFSPPSPSPSPSPPSKKRRLSETECAEEEDDEDDDDEFAKALQKELENQQCSPSKPPPPKKRRLVKPRKNPPATLFAGNKRNIQRASTPPPPPASPSPSPPASPLHPPPPRLPLPRGWDYRHVLQFRHQLADVFLSRETSQLAGIELRNAMAERLDDDILEQLLPNEATAGLFSRLLEVRGEKVILRELKEVKRRMAMEDWDEFAEAENEDCVVMGAKRKETEVIVVD